MGSRQRFEFVRLAAAGALCASLVVGASAQTLSAGAIRETSPMKSISGLASDCSDPVLVSQGETVFAAWTGSLGGRTLLWTARFDGSRWSRPSIPAQIGAGEDATPDVAISQWGQPGVTWVHHDQDAFDIYYQSGREAPQRVAHSVGTRLETPSIGFDAAGLPFVAWTRGSGTRFSVEFSRLTREGNWQTVPLSLRKDAYDILPAAFGGPKPVIYWYSLDGGSATLKAAELDRVGWRTTGLGDLGIIPPNRLPILFETASALEPGAVWVEPVKGSEIVLTYDPARSAETPIAGVPFADPAARQLEPDATTPDGQTVFAWREELGSDSLLLATDGTNVWQADGLPALSQPRVATTTDGVVHLVAVSDASVGGTGSVCWTSFRLSN